MVWDGGRSAIGIQSQESWGGYLGGGGGISFCRLVMRFPPPEIFRTIRAIIFGLVANIFLPQGGTGACVLHVRISPYATAHPEKIFLLYSVHPQQ